MKKKTSITLLTLLIILISTTIIIKESIYINKIYTYINKELLKITILTIFNITYILVVIENYTKIKKSTITIIFSSLIWVLISINYTIKNNNYEINIHIKEHILAYSEILLFLFVAMTYINTLENRNVFEKIKSSMITKKLSYRQIYTLTGILAFMLSPIADNLTTALLFCSIIVTTGKNNKNFINLACINIVIASNAGGVFSPFGDVTTLMIWQKNILPFDSFFKIFLPSLISFIIPSVIMGYKIKNEKIETKISKTNLLPGSKQIIILFIITIIISITFQNYLNIPSSIGMLTGLGLLQIYELLQKKKNKNNFKINEQISKIDWETLLFFYGIILCVGGISITGSLNEIITFIYNDINKNLSQEYRHTIANITIGLISAIIDNVPLTYAIISINPQMTESQWLLATLTTGIGGSLSSIGSAAGVAIMGKAKGMYTFKSHLKYSWAILLGYAIGILTHIKIN